MYYLILSLFSLAAYTRAQPFPNVTGSPGGIASIRPVAFQQFCMSPNGTDSTGNSNITFSACNDANKMFTLFLSEKAVILAQNTSQVLDWDGTENPPTLVVEIRRNKPSQQWFFINRGSIKNIQNDKKCLQVDISGPSPGEVSMQNCSTLVNPSTNEDKTGQAWMFYT